jgi:hypothetical protein
MRIYYQNRKTGEFMVTVPYSTRDLISEPTPESIALGFKGYKTSMVCDVILPNKCLGNGIISFTMSYVFIKNNYKRVKKSIVLEKYPDLHQYRFEDIPKFTQEERLEILKKQTI